MYLFICVTELPKTNTKAASEISAGPTFEQFPPPFKNFTALKKKKEREKKKAFYAHAVCFKEVPVNRYEMLCGMIQSELTYPEACMCSVCNLLINSFSTPAI